MADAGSGPTDPDPPPDPENILDLFQSEGAEPRDGGIYYGGVVQYLKIENGRWALTTADDHHLTYVDAARLAAGEMVEGTTLFTSGTVRYGLIHEMKDGVRWATASPM